MDQGFLDTLVQLAKIGSAGVGVAVLLMVFIMIMKGKPVDPDTAKLRSNFLQFGVGFAIVVGLLALVPTFFASSGGPVALRLSFSPDMKSAGLSPPETLLPDGKTVPAEAEFSLPPSALPQVLTVKVDKTIDEVRDLKQTASTLAASVATATQQTNTLAQQVTPPTAAPGAQQTLTNQTQQTQQLQTEVAKSIQTGDFARANAFSNRLHQSVVATRPAISQIVGGHP